MLLRRALPAARQKAAHPFLILIWALCSLAPAIHVSSGPPELAIRGVGQNLNGVQISNTTNIVGGTTNFTQAFKSTTTNFTMDAGSLFALLENSFNTNFPAGCRLILVGQGPRFFFAVSDPTGTNVGLYPSQVLSTSFLNSDGYLFSGINTQTSTNDVEIISGKDTGSFGSVLTFTYDDTAMTNTTDGTHTKFTWVGLVQDKSVATLVPTGAGSTWIYNDNATITIIGNGSIRFPTNVAFADQSMAVFSGSIRAKVTGL